MLRRLALAVLIACSGAPAIAATLQLERVVMVERHGVRPPTQSNSELAKYAAQPWPDWPVAPGELTPHGSETVHLMGASLRRVYAAAGLLPAYGCAPAGAVSVWADGTDERTRRSGQLMADTLAPGCGVTEAHAPASPRDPIFDDSGQNGCPADQAKIEASLAAAAAGPASTLPVESAVKRLQAILAPDACHGGAGTCFTPTKGAAGLGRYGAAPSLAEDLLLEYADAKPLQDVGWGRARAADIAAVMPVHERIFWVLRDAPYLVAHRGAHMAGVILAALQGAPTVGGPQSGPGLKVLVLAGHDTNLALMAGAFGLRWTLPGEPDGTAPSTVLAFEVWSDGRRQFVRPVIYYERLDQLRTLAPANAAKLALRMSGCDSGPLGSCPLATVVRHLQALIPPECQTAKADTR